MNSIDRVLRRSVLFMPASNLRAVTKARKLPCDAVILDLEDAVGPASKQLARQQAVAAVTEGGFGRREVVIRVNGLDTEWGREDLLAAGRCGADAILVPKIYTADDVLAYDAYLSGPTRLWVMIETCRSLFNLDAICQTAKTTRLSVCVAGTNDLVREMRCRTDAARIPLVTLLCLIVASARAHGLGVLDAVYNDFMDDTGLGEQCRQGVDLGFDGKTLIHPRQIGAANSAFVPLATDITWANQVIAAFGTADATGKNVLQVDGQMVERLQCEQAERLVAIAGMIAGLAD